MKVSVVKVGDLLTNCYIVCIGNSAIIIDPSDDYDLIKSCLGDYDLKGILITHSHFDHVGALSYFKDVAVYDYNNLSLGNNIIDEFSFEVIYTFGHTSDSISFYFKEYNCMFVGDFIFKNSIGRTDLESGDDSLMRDSLLKLRSYPSDTVLYPGHGDSTILKDELKNNPFLSDL